MLRPGRVSSTRPAPIGECRQNAVGPLANSIAIAATTSTTALIACAGRRDQKRIVRISAARMMTTARHGAGRREQRERAELRRRSRPRLRPPCSRYVVDMPSDVFSTFAEKRDEDGELSAGDECRKKDHDDGHEAPREHEARESERAESAKKQRKRRETVAEGEGNRDRERFDGAEHRECAECRARPSQQGVDEAAGADSRQCHREDQPEGVRRAAEDRRKHAVPDELHQKEREPDHRGGRVDESMRRDGRSRGRFVGDVRIADPVRIGNRGQPDDGVEQRGRNQRLEIAEGLQEVERRENRPDDRSDGVCRIKNGYRKPAGVVALHRPRGCREGAAHQNRRDREDHDRQKKPHDRRHELPEGEGASHGEIQVANQPEQDRGEAREEGHPDFEEPIDGKGITETVDPLADEQASQAEAAHEDREDSGGGRRRRPENQPELTQPDRLIDERARAGAEEQQAHAPDTRFGCHGAIIAGIIGRPLPFHNPRANSPAVMGLRYNIHVRFSARKI